tara:strand:- start:30 stop:248 length:219 start_codon:yes stop_codon:yes gene_type:complete
VINWLTFIPAIFELLGVKLLGDKKKLGFISSAIGNVLWIIYVFISNSTYGLLLVCGIAIFLNIRGFIKWRKQ